MITAGQTINYNKYRALLKTMPAPIMREQIPANVKIDLSGLLAYAKEKGKLPIDLTNEEKNRFITGGKVENLQSMIQASVKYHSLDEWNLAH